jgi:hypothetical protein
VDLVEAQRQGRRGEGGGTVELEPRESWAAQLEVTGGGGRHTGAEEGGGRQQRMRTVMQAEVLRELGAVRRR